MATKKKTTAKRSKKNNKKTYVAIVLDRSGSMSSIHKQTVEGINEQLRALKDNADKGGDTLVSLVQFDTQIETVFDNVNAKELKYLTEGDFQPRGGTAMYDGIWNAINLLKSKEQTDDTSYLICVISDGQENASQEISQQILSDEIKKLQSGNWVFTYLLSNVDIHAVQQALDIKNSSIAIYNSSVAGAAYSYTANATSTVNYMSARNDGVVSPTTHDFYSPEQQAKIKSVK